MNFNNLLKNLIYLGSFLVPLVPFIVSKSLLFPFITGKAFIFRIIVEIIFALWLILILREPEYRPRSSWILKAAFLFVLIVLLADIFALDPHKAFWSNFERMEGLLAIIHLLAYFLVVGSVFRGKEIWNRFFGLNVAASAIMAIYSFLQLAGKITINQGGTRVDGTFGNATYLGIYMVFSIFLAAILFLQYRGIFQRWVLGTVVLIDLIVLYFTATRGAILGLLGGVFISFAYLAIKAEKGERIRKVAALSLLLLIVLSGIFWGMKNTSFVQQSLVLSRFANISFSEIQNQGRYYVWPMAWKGFLEKPILGWGQEGFNYVFNKYYDSRMYNQEPWFDRTHGIILDWLINAGVLGLLSYLFLFGSLIYYIRKRASSITKEEKAILYGLIFAYFFHNIFVFDQIGSYIMFFTILAYIHSLSSDSTTSGRLDGLYYRFKNFFGTEGMRPIWDSASVILLALVLYFVIYVPWRQNTQIMAVLRSSAENKVASTQTFTKPLENYSLGFPEAVEHVSQSFINVVPKTEASDEFKTDVFNIIDASFKKLLENKPYDVRNRILYGMFLSQLGMYEQSLLQLEEAIKYSPNKQSIYVEKGSELVLLGKPLEALPIFKKAYELEPSYEETLFTYAMGAIYAKDFVLAEELIQKIPEDKLISDNRYVGALFSVGRYNEAIKVLTERIGKDPTNRSNRISLASIYLQIGMREAAISQIQEIIKTDPSFKEQGEYYISEIQAGRNP